jgi:pyruvate-formate lyase-activating enzyme
MITQNIFSTGAQKLLFYPQRIDNWQNGKPIVPITLEIQPSERCNHHCPHCQGKFALERLDALNRSKNGALLDLSLLKTIWELPPEGIVISGNTGDPLLHPEIDKLLMVLGDRSIPSVLITNGQLLTSDLADLIVQICRGIRISIDAYDEHSFALTHGVKNSWPRLMENISALVETKRKYPASHCHIGVGFLTSARSKPWMLPATHLAKSLGVDYIQFRPYHYDTTDVIDALNSCEELVPIKNIQDWAIVLIEVSKAARLPGFILCLTQGEICIYVVTMSGMKVQE